MTEKLQKVLARAGLGSRREIEAWISAGLVRVNGEPANLGTRVGGRDEIQVRGRRLTALDLITPETQVLLYNKPEGELVTRSDEKGRETVFEHISKPKSGRWIAVGRLDINTTGLLLLTNNGELANRLMHPSQAVERSYLVRVFGEVSPEILERLQAGVSLEDGMAKFDTVMPMLSEETDSLNRWYMVTLLEGRNREVRRLWESQGVRVSRLKRIAFGGISMPQSLKLGKSQAATPDQINHLLGLVGLPPLSQPRQEAPSIRRARNFALTAATPRDSARAQYQKPSQKTTSRPDHGKPERRTEKKNHPSRTRQGRDR